MQFKPKELQQQSQRSKIPSLPLAFSEMRPARGQSSLFAKVSIV